MPRLPAHERAYWQHCRHFHRHPKPPPPQRTIYEHPDLTARPCTQQGDPLPENAPPPPRPVPLNTAPFADRASFDFVNTVYNKMQGSAADINAILRAMLAHDILHGHNEEDSMFSSYTEVVDTINEINEGPPSFQSFSVRWVGHVDENSPQWKREQYAVHHVDIISAMRAMASNTELDGHWDYTPVAVFNADGSREFSNLMTGQWAWDQADQAAVDPRTHGSMLTPILLGADKTTVSVGTGNRAYHPLYGSAGNIHNDMRCSHTDAVTTLAFLPIIKGTREDANDKEFRLFRKQVYHMAIERILAPLRPHMEVPLPLRCPDGHWRGALFELGPFLVDYPEQVYVARIVQGWCPKCLAFPDSLDRPGVPRFRVSAEHLQRAFDPGTLWDLFGLLSDVTPFTYAFPRADVYQLLTPDLLHQLVKGTFKDHLVAWIEEYIVLTAPSEARAQQTLDDLDRRLAAVPSFTGLHRFPDGRHFSQWTGNDSKALMKVLLPALVGLVPDRIVECIRVFLDFAYLARQSVHTTHTVDHMEELLEEFRNLRQVFIDTGVRDDISLPRQHGLDHMPDAIEQFGSLNGVSTSITETKHIVAVKQPWRASNRGDALPQMLRRIVRVGKINALRVSLSQSGHLQGDIVEWALRKTGRLPPHQAQYGPARQPPLVAEAQVTFGTKPTIPDLHAMIRRFLRAKRYPGVDPPDVVVPLNDCPWVSPNEELSMHLCAHATYYAPSELSLPGGMYSEIIRCTPFWLRREPHYDTVLVQVGDPDDIMHGMAVAQVRRLFSFSTCFEVHPCALVEWFDPVMDTPDALTGMWVVRPEIHNNQRAMDIIPLDSIVRSCHLIPYFGTQRLRRNWKHYNTLHAFNHYYINCYIDYHTYELLK
ncbi:uncharacterized protein BXZ73DRAFT_92536 [Epithele typhae]|uniref:uncharacterized protein n=1 Tax=Epithele typhae TaxID=378194 RepID=UPI002007D9F9|nr:uncharacterized protein BXZ73DRAFT_92536 [Epithele typhae]KAH9916112.1 hypothetical protein BXZ73DRAFT_92536 [Epithele typhae]